MSEKAKVWVERDSQGKVTGVYRGGPATGEDTVTEAVDFDHPDVVAFEANSS